MSINGIVGLPREVVLAVGMANLLMYLKSIGGSRQELDLWITLHSPDPPVDGLLVDLALDIAPRIVAAHAQRLRSKG
jgi:hypothetical protein